MTALLATAACELMLLKYEESSMLSQRVMPQGQASKKLLITK